MVHQKPIWLPNQADQRLRDLRQVAVKLGLMSVCNIVAWPERTDFRITSLPTISLRGGTLGPGWIIGEPQPAGSVVTIESGPKRDDLRMHYGDGAVEVKIREKFNWRA